MKRRLWVGSAGASALLAAYGSMGLLSGCASTGQAASANKARVVVVGGGFGGATAAKYVRMWSHYGMSVTLIEPHASFVSCPISNLVLSGVKTMADITLPYDTLVKQHGVQLVRDSVVRIDANQRLVFLAGGGQVPYDRLIVSPGVELMWDTLPGMARPGAQDKVLHAWKAGPQTVALRHQLTTLPNGGVVALTVPLAPFRCHPGPYERATQIASYFSRFKPRSKVLLLDANDDLLSEGAQFKRVWASRYPDQLEYRPKQRLADVDAATGTLQFESGADVRAKVLNVIPPMRAGQIAIRSGLAGADQRWCEVDFLTFESRVAKNIHVIGDAVQNAKGMAKSGHMANQHGKTCAAAVVALLSGKSPNVAPLYNNVRYSFVSAEDAMPVVGVHAYDAQQQTMVTLLHAGGASKVPDELEGRAAWVWAQGIWDDTLT